MEVKAGGRLQLTVFTGSEKATSSETKSESKSACNEPSDGRFGRHSLITRNASACMTGSHFDHFQHLTQAQRSCTLYRCAYAYERHVSMQARALNHSRTRGSSRGDSFPPSGKLQELGRPPCSTQARPHHILSAVNFKLRGGASDP